MERGRAREVFSFAAPLTIEENGLLGSGADLPFFGVGGRRAIATTQLRAVVRAASGATCKPLHTATRAARDAQLRRIIKIHGTRMFRNEHTTNERTGGWAGRGSF